MIAGAVLSTADLCRGDDKPFHVRVVDAAHTPENVAALRGQLTLWGALVADYARRNRERTLTTETLVHARFAESVLFRAAALLTTQPAIRADHVLLACCVKDDEVVGVLIFKVEGGRGYLDWATVHPRYLVGAPTPAAEQVAGIGTSLVCAAGEAMEQAGARSVQLDPLDEEAERFWEGRGFHWEETGDGHAHLVASGAAVLANACRRQPDSAAQGDCIGCKAAPRHTSWRQYALGRSAR